MYSSYLVRLVQRMAMPQIANPNLGKLGRHSRWHVCSLEVLDCLLNIGVMLLSGNKSS